MSAEYVAPFRFSGTIEKIVIDTQPVNLTSADEKTLTQAQASSMARE